MYASPSAPHDPLGDATRLEALRRTGLLSSGPDPMLDRVILQTRETLATSTALFTLVDGERQHMRSSVGLDASLAAVRSLPLSYSICQHVVRQGTVLAVDDTTRSDLTWDSNAVTELGIRSYLGAPVREPSGFVLGALCAVGTEPRQWTQAERAAIESLALALESEVARRCQPGSAFPFPAAALARLSHEVRTPVASIFGYADELMATVGPEAAGDVDAIRRCTRRLLRTLSAVLDLAAISAGLVEPRREAVDLARVAREALGDAAHEAKGLGLVVETEEPHPVAWADQGLVRSVLKHLVSNAVKFTDAGTLHIRTWREGGQAVFAVTDTGIGIDEALLPNVFEPFRQALPPGAPECEGVGLGLALAERLVELMGGRLTLESTPGEGTTATVRLTALA